MKPIILLFVIMLIIGVRGVEIDDEGASAEAFEAAGENEDVLDDGNPEPTELFLQDNEEAEDEDEEHFVEAGRFIRDVFKPKTKKEMAKTKGKGVEGLTKGKVVEGPTKAASLASSKKLRERRIFETLEDILDFAQTKPVPTRSTEHGQAAMARAAEGFNAFYKRDKKKKTTPRK